MIDPDEFNKWWSKFERRWGKSDTDTSVEYMVWMNEQRMDTAEFETVARYLWSRDRFWPPPLDFLSLRRSAEWAAVREVIGSFGSGRMPTGARGEVLPDWIHLRNALPASSQAAIRALGGVRALAESRRDMITLREHFVEHVGIALSTLLPEIDSDKQLTMGRAPSRQIES